MQTTAVESRAPAAPDAAAIRQRPQAMWASGDFSMIAAGTTIVGELLCESVDLRSGQKVLDVATGSGNTALAAARRWCDVTGVDFVPGLLERARERAAVERLPIEFQEADCENLPFPIASFDAVLSTFGVAFAADQERAANELLRVCRSGGKIGLTYWTPDGFVGELQSISAKYMPPPPHLKPPRLWGTEERLRELFGDRIRSLELARRSLVMRFRSIGHWLEFSRSYLGPVRQTIQSLDAAGRESIAREVTEAARRFNRSGDDTMVVPAEYLEAVAVRR